MAIALSNPGWSISSLGQCIYCGDSTRPRTREHVIPYSLSGNWVIQDASCDTCAVTTSKIERRCSRGFFSEIRAHLGLATRRRRQFPKHLNVTELSNGGNRYLPVPVRDHPYRFITFDLEPACFLAGEEPSEILYVRAVAIEFQQDYERRVSLLATKSIVQDAAIDYFGLYALIAKIAHAYTIAQLGINAFHPLLLDVILGKPVPVSMYIGGIGVIGDVTPWSSIHRCRVFEKTVKGDSYLCCDVQLFSNLGAPIYRVVVGRKKGGG